MLLHPELNVVLIRQSDIFPPDFAFINGSEISVEIRAEAESLMQTSGIWNLQKYVHHQWKWDIRSKEFGSGLSLAPFVNVAYLKWNRLSPDTDVGFLRNMTVKGATFIAEGIGHMKKRVQKVICSCTSWSYPNETWNESKWKLTNTST